MSTYLRDVPNQVASGVSHAANLTGNTNGAVIDFLTGDGRCTLQVVCGLFNSTTSSSFQVKDSTDNSTFNSISGAIINCTNTASGLANSVQWISFDRTARYIRVDATVTGSALGMNATAVVIEQKKQI